jgi:two-component system chemotaxis sensor kinase CheA
MEKTSIQASGFSEVLQGKKALVVDDDPQNIFLMKHILTREKINVITAVNGLDGLKKLEENPDIDIVLMDIMMPVMNGYEAIKAIRKQKKHRGLPIIVVTANALADPKTYAAAGASDYLIKPIDKHTMFEMMAVWMMDIE